MSSHETSGIVAKPSRLLEGTMRGRTASKAAIVIAVSSNPGGSGMSFLRAVLMSLMMESTCGITGFSPSRSIVCSRSSACRSSASLYCAICQEPALPARSFRSAPTKPAVLFASEAKSTSAASERLLVCARMIAARTCSLGTPMLISVSKRPPRLRAGSIASGLFVAARTMTGFSLSLSSSSIETSSWATIRFSI